MEILKYEEHDIEEIVDLFVDTVHKTSLADYTEQQLDIWAPPDEKKQLIEEWKKTLRQHISYVAKYNNKLIGFSDLTLQGELKRIYVHKNYIRNGIATKLLEKLEGEAYELGLPHITTISSITAVPFFKSQGYKITSNENTPGVHIPTENMIMQKEL
ncbi:MAG: GNAT family N-acetyltransferase [Kurthia sp.]|nr:GNAT family N-acetyltransferase [Candidatus Kurthia equi]